MHVNPEVVSLTAPDLVTWAKLFFHYAYYKGTDFQHLVSTGRF